MYSRMFVLTLAAGLLLLSSTALTDDAPGAIATVAGGGPMGDGGFATDAAVVWPVGVATDGAGNVYLLDTRAGRIRRVDRATGIIATVAGNGGTGFSGDGGPAVDATIGTGPESSIAVDAVGNIYFGTQTNRCVRRVDAQTGTISTLMLGVTPRAMAIGPAGGLFVAERTVVWRLDLGTGGSVRVAGGGSPPDGIGDGGSATSAKFEWATSLAFDAEGHLFIAEDRGIRRVDPGDDGVLTGAGDETISTVALRSRPPWIAFDALGDLLVGHGTAVLRIDAGSDRLVRGSPDETITVVAGTLSWNYEISDDGVPATEARFGGIDDAALDPWGNLYLGGANSFRVWRIVPGADGVITGQSDEILTRLAGTGGGPFTGAGAAAVLATLGRTSGVALDAAGNLFVSAGAQDGLVLRIDSGADGVVTGAADETISVVAGTGWTIIDRAGRNPLPVDGALAVETWLGRPSGLAFDRAGNLFITNPHSHSRIFRVAAGSDGLITGASDEVITIVAGERYSPGDFAGDGGPATEATISSPQGLAFDAAGDLYFVDANHGRVRRIQAGADGLVTGAEDEIITTVAGNGAVFGSPSGDGGPATDAALGNLAVDVAFDSEGNLFIAAAGVRRVAAGSDGKITGASDETITTVAGGGASFPGNGGPATDAQLGNFVAGLSFDHGGNMFLMSRALARRIDAGADGRITGDADEIITTVAGSATLLAGFWGDGGPAVDAGLSDQQILQDVVIDAGGNLLIADFGNRRVRRVIGAGVPLNLPPVIGPCDNVTITTQQQSGTTLECEVSDPDGDDLTCRWIVDGVPRGPFVPVVGTTCTLPLGDLDPLAVGDHEFVLEVSDGQATTSATIIVTVENSPPVAAPTGGGVYEVGPTARIPLGGQVADFDGDLLLYIWMHGDQELGRGTIQPPYGGDPTDLPVLDVDPAILGVEIHYDICLVLDDGINDAVEACVTVEVLEAEAPTLCLTASATILWPPNNQMVDVVVHVEQCEGGDPVTLSVEVTTDEGVPAEDVEVVSIDQATGDIHLRLRAARQGKGDGHTYTVTVTATDAAGNAGTASITIVAPHDQGRR